MGKRGNRHEEFIRNLIEHPEQRRSIRFSEIVSALEGVGCKVTVNSAGDNCLYFHPDHPNKRMKMGIGRPHSGKGSGETVLPSYIHHVCEYFSEMWDEPE